MLPDFLVKSAAKSFLPQAIPMVDKLANVLKTIEKERELNNAAFVITTFYDVTDKTYKVKLSVADTREHSDKELAAEGLSEFIIIKDADNPEKLMEFYSTDLAPIIAEAMK